MSWMDSWSRPNKQSATPPPLYLTQPDAKYCSTCGRVIGNRRAQQKNKVVKYCSDGCRNHRPGPVDKKIDRTILAMLEGRDDSGLDVAAVQGRFRKGDRRIVITMNEIEKVAFNRVTDSADDPGTKTDEEFDDEDMQKYLTKNNALAIDTTDEDSGEDHGVSLPTSEADETDAKSAAVAELNQKRQAGQRRADEREMVRRSARRAVVFGYPAQAEEQLPVKSKKGAKVEESSGEPPRRYAEAIMNGKLVEPSFAKGNWSVRWRED